jgi:uncharacterized membrane protein SpoIIM required for sporulation/uncharacterized RDD family membrane protein YckC
MPATLKTAPSFERRLEIETPEHVAIGYSLADLGSRYAALLLDTLLLLAILAALWGIPYLIAARLAEVPPTMGGWALGAIILVSFAVAWGYFIVFEAFRDGQTPGKRRLGIRVVHEGGYPVSLQGAAIRNLVRLIDVQPIPACLVGGAVMMLHPRTQRLGDIAAATVVVRERTFGTLPEESGPDRVPTGAPRLEPAEYEALAAYVARRGSLPEDVRRRLAGQLAAHLAEGVGWDREVESADAYLVALHTEERARGAAPGGTGGSPAAAALVRRQQPVWSEFRELLERAQRRGLPALGETELARFGTLYRETAADLARARTYGGSPALVYTLERLVAAGHNLLYRPRLASLREARAWVTRGFPALVRRRWRPIALAAALLYVPALISFAVVRSDPPLARAFIPPEMIARAEAGVQMEREGRGYVEIPEIAMPVFASRIAANNVQVTIVAFAGGVLAGLGTAAVLVFNGVFLGGVAALFANHGLSLHLWTFVLPHGVIELTAIAIGGGAGLWMGSAVVLPGRRTRREAIAARGREAVSLLGGTVLLLLVAGAIEGFISPAPIPRPLKLSLAALFAVLLAAYLSAGARGVRAGRGASPPGTGSPSRR